MLLTLALSNVGRAGAAMSYFECRNPPDFEMLLCFRTVKSLHILSALTLEVTELDQQQTTLVRPLASRRLPNLCISLSLDTVSRDIKLGKLIVTFGLVPLGSP